MKYCSQLACVKHARLHTNAVCVYPCGFAHWFAPWVFYVGCAPLHIVYTTHKRAFYVGNVPTLQSALLHPSTFHKVHSRTHNINVRRAPTAKPAPPKLTLSPQCYKQCYSTSNPANRPLLLSGQPPNLIQPLASRAQAWQAIPGI